MKRFLFTLVLAGVVFSAAAQEPEKKEEKKEEGYRFTDVKVLPTNAIKNQYRSGTCWCFSTLSFLEDEIRRALSLINISEPTRLAKWEYSVL